MPTPIPTTVCHGIHGQADTRDGRAGVARCNLQVRRGSAWGLDRSSTVEGRPSIVVGTVVGFFLEDRPSAVVTVVLDVFKDGSLSGDTVAANAEAIVTAYAFVERSPRRFELIAV